MEALIWLFSIFWEEPFFTGMIIIGGIGLWFALKYDELKKKLKALQKGGDVQQHE